MCVLFWLWVGKASAIANMNGQQWYGGGGVGTLVRERLSRGVHVVSRRADGERVARRQRGQLAAVRADAAHRRPPLSAHGKPKIK